MDSFEQAFACIVGHEGGLTMNPADPGNWTGEAITHGDELWRRADISPDSPHRNAAFLLHLGPDIKQHRPWRR